MGQHGDEGPGGAPQDDGGGFGRLADQRAATSAALAVPPRLAEQVTGAADRFAGRGEQAVQDGEFLAGQREQDTAAAGLVAAGVQIEVGAPQDEGPAGEPAPSGLRPRQRL